MICDKGGEYIDNLRSRKQDNWIISLSSPFFILVTWHVLVSEINKNSILISYPILVLIIFRIIDRFHVQSKPQIFVQKHEQYDLLFDDFGFLQDFNREYYISILISIIFCITGISTVDTFIDFFSTQNPFIVYDGFWIWLAFTLLFVACIGVIQIISLMVFADLTKVEIQACQRIKDSPQSELFSLEGSHGDRAKFLKEFGHHELTWGESDLYNRLKAMINGVIGFNILFISNGAFFLWILGVFGLDLADLSTTSVQPYYSLALICFFSYFNHSQHITASYVRTENFRINQLADKFSKEYSNLLMQISEEE